MTRTRLFPLVALLVVTVGLGPAGAVASPDGTLDRTDARTTMSCDFPYTTTDATGTEVRIPEEPERVVVLGPSGTQTMWEIGASGKVVGIDKFSTYLEGAGNVTVVSQGIGKVDYEAVFEQNPDLVIVSGNSYSDKVARELRKGDVPVYQFGAARNLSDITQKTMQYGRLVGECAGAHETATAFENRVETVRNATSGVEEPSLFFVLGGGYTAGPNTFIGAVIEAAGASNVVANGNFSSPYPKVSDEFVLEQDPEWLLVTYTPGSQYGASTPEEARQMVANSSVLSRTQAYERGNVVVVNANNLTQPAPRVAVALTEIVKAIHPEAYAEANATTTTTPAGTTTAANATTSTTATSTTTSTTTDGGTTDGTTTPTTTAADGGQPGFGALVALAALAGALLVARR